MRGETVRVIFALIIMAFGLLDFFNPYLTWYLSTGWQFRDTEPSDAALKMGRIMGPIIFLVGLGILLWK